MSTPCVFDCIRKHLREESSSCESLQDLCRFDNEIMIKIIRLSSKGALIIAVFLRLHTISLIFGLADGSVQWHRSQSTALALNSHLSTFPPVRRPSTASMRHVAKAPASMHRCRPHARCARLHGADGHAHWVSCPQHLQSNNIQNMYIFTVNSGRSYLSGFSRSAHSRRAQYQFAQS